MTETLTRMSIVLGDRTLDVAVPARAPLYEALHAVGVGTDDPGLTVVDSTGRHVGLYDTTGVELADGAVLHVVHRDARRRAGYEDRAGGDGADDLAVARPAAVPWWLGVAGAAAAVLVAVVVLDVVQGPGGASAGTPLAERRGLAGVLAVAAIAIGVVRGRPGVWGAAWPAAVAAAVAAGAGALTVDPAVVEGGRLAVVAALAAATAVTAARWGALRRQSDGAADVAVALLVVVATAGAVCAAALLVGLPGAIVAAVLLGAVPLGVRALPTLALDVPDGQLVDVSVVAHTVTGVREPPARRLGRVNHRMMQRTVRAAERRRDAGTVLLSGLAVIVAPVLLLTAPTSALTTWTAVGAVAAVAAVLALQPRSTRGALARWAPRTAAAVLLVEVVVLGVPGVADHGALVPLAVLGLGVLVSLLAVPMTRGWRSVGVSRLADAIEGLAAVVALPVALVGAGAVEVFRQVTSR